MNAAADNRTFSLDSFPLRMRVDQCAAYLNCSADRVLRLIRSGALAAIDLTGPGATKRKHYVITREAISQFERKNKST